MLVLLVPPCDLLLGLRPVYKYRRPPGGLLLELNAPPYPLYLKKIERIRPVLESTIKHPRRACPACGGKISLRARRLPEPGRPSAVFPLWQCEGAATLSEREARRPPEAGARPEEGPILTLGRGPSTVAVLPEAPRADGFRKAASTFIVLWPNRTT